MNKIAIIKLFPNKNLKSYIRPTYMTNEKNLSQVFKKKC